MNEIEHPFSIIAIKDGYNAYPNKYLLYYDERWSCWFFPNFRTLDDENDNLRNIRDNLSGWLQISSSGIELEYKTQAVQEKYSASDHVRKMYHHRLYSATLPAFPDVIQKKRFSLDGKKYVWMSIAEMESDPSIQDNNADVVALVKGHA